MKTIAISIALAVSLAGCMSMPRGPSGAELAEADYGAPIGGPEAEAIAREFMASTLKDPHSAEWRCGPTSPQYITDGVVYGGATHFGWGLECAINARNSFGGYTGFRTYQFLFRDGRLIAAYTQELQRGGGSYMRRIL